MHNSGLDLVTQIYEPSGFSLKASLIGPRLAMGRSNQK